MPVPMPRAVKRATLLGSAAAMVVFLLLASAGELQLMSRRYTSDFYDLQARRMFHGHLTVPVEKFGLEAFVVNGHSHMYFGPLPSFLRMPVLLVTSRLDGRLTQVSMALAFALLLFAIGRLSWRIRTMLRGDEPVDRLDVIVAALAPFVLGAGSVALYLGAAPVVYHEAILWGVATAVAASVALVEHVIAPTRRTLLVLGVAVTAVLFSRAAVGFGTVASVGAVLVALVLRRYVGRRRSFARLAAFAGSGSLPPSGRNILGLVAVVAVPMALYVALNEARFHRPLGPPYAEQVWTDISPERRAALEANGGSLFNVDYVPSTALAYLRPDGVSAIRLFPFVDFRPERATVVGNAVFDTRDRTGSVPATMPAVTALAVVGSAAVLSRRHRGQLAALRSLVLGGAVAVSGVLTIGFIAQRYLGDFLPVLVPLALVGGIIVVRSIASVPSTIPRRAAWAGVIGLVAASVWINLGLGLLVQRAYWAPDTGTRHDFLSFQQSLDEKVFGDPRYLSGPTRPSDDAGTRGELFVVGECEQLLWHDSWVWVEVEPLPDGTTPLCLRLLH